jgi:hypothetical protein
MTLKRLSTEKECLISSFPKQGKRFSIKLQHLLNPTQKKNYYNEVLKIILDQISNKSNDVAPISIISHLKHHLELEYCNEDLLEKAVALLSDKLVK